MSHRRLPALTLLLSPCPQRTLFFAALLFLSFSSLVVSSIFSLLSSFSLPSRHC
jgi:hypothetical protein